MQGREYLKKKLDRYRRGALKLNEIYDMKDKDMDFGITIPPELRRQYQATSGWCSKAVDGSERHVWH
ncbi:hypothetical protein ACTQ5F_08020 [Jeotgalibaca porci]|uniref:hypothetical protein n=1 Tax=Jeotgalibaca porci TaxID=1868793 RepID=UPI003F92938A